MADFFSANWYRVAKLRPALNPGVRASRHRYRGEAWYVLHETISGRSHRVTPVTYGLLGRMDGQRTLQALWDEALERLGDEAPTQDELVELLGQLHAADMVRCDVPPDAAELFDRYDRAESNRRWSRMRSPLAIRVPLWDPDRFLLRTLRWVRPLVGWRGFVLWAALVLPCMVLAAMHWSELTENLSDRVLAMDNLFVLIAVFPVVKALHELGHAYATRVMGGEVHEMGIMFLVLTPIPYVDSTRANAFRSKWQRAGVGAAGMLVETAIASLALLAWLALEPGIVRSVCFNVMVIAGVSTLLFNLNPLLKFDGYYILCDLVEIPNLAARSQRYLAERIEDRLFGVTSARPTRLAPGEAGWLLCYAPLAAAYRVFVMLSIAVFIAGSYFFIGVALALWAVAQGIVWPICKGVWHVLAGHRLARRRGTAVTVSASIALVAGTLLFVLPAPDHVIARGVVWLPDDARLRAGTSGFVDAVLVRPGERVDAGTVVLRLSEPSVAAEHAAQVARVDELAARLEGVRFTERVQAELARRALEAEAATLRRLDQELHEQVVSVRAAGDIVLPRAADLPGRFVHKGDLLGHVSAGEHRLVRVVVDQTDIDAVRQRLRGVAVRLAFEPESARSARLVREVPAGRDELPSRALAAVNGGPFALDPTDREGRRTLGRVFQFDVELDDAAAGAPVGARAHVRFTLDSAPLGLQAWRRVRQLFLSRFDV